MKFEELLGRLIVDRGMLQECVTRVAEYEFLMGWGSLRNSGHIVCLPC